MNKADAHNGMRVVFGHADGDQTLGRIVRLKPTRAMVESLQERAGRAAGVRWNVPYHLMRAADDQQAPATSVDE